MEKVELKTAISAEDLDKLPRELREPMIDYASQDGGPQAIAALQRLLGVPAGPLDELTLGKLDPLSCDASRLRHLRNQYVKATGRATSFLVEE